MFLLANLCRGALLVRLAPSTSSIRHTNQLLHLRFLVSFSFFLLPIVHLVEWLLSKFSFWLIIFLFNCSELQRPDACRFPIRTAQVPDVQTWFSSPKSCCALFLSCMLAALPVMDCFVCVCCWWMVEKRGLVINNFQPKCLNLKFKLKNKRNPSADEFGRNTMSISSTTDSVVHPFGPHRIWFTSDSDRQTFWPISQRTRILTALHSSRRVLLLLQTASSFRILHTEFKLNRPNPRPPTWKYVLK